MRGELLNEVLAEFRQKRADNAGIEAERYRHAVSVCPEIAELYQKRRDMILGSLHIRWAADPDKDAPAPAYTMADVDNINQRIRDLLALNGFTPDYLQPVYDCPTCQDTGYTGDPVREMCECIKTVYHSRLFSAVGLNEKSPQTFERYDETVYSDIPLPGRPVSPRKLAVLHRDTARKYADDFPRTEKADILMTGQSGVGKTFLLHAIAHRVLERGFYVLCVSAYRVIEMARNAHFANDPGEMSTLFEAELLMIDDLGTEPMMENITIPHLYNLINERQQGNLHTVITTNLSMEKLRERYTERIASRITNPGQCFLMGFAGGDVRQGNA